MKKITKREVKDKRVSQVVNHLRLSGLKMSATLLKNLQNKVIQEGGGIIMRDWVERAEDELDKQLTDGLITMKEYQRCIRELREEADEAGYYDGADRGDY